MMFCWHRWAAWEVEDTGAVMRKRLAGDEVVVGRYLIQKRACEKCGKKQLDFERATR